MIFTRLLGWDGDVVVAAAALGTYAVGLEFRSGQGDYLRGINILIKWICHRYTTSELVCGRKLKTIASLPFEELLSYLVKVENYCPSE